jgi:hypothetical protein
VGCSNVAPAQDCSITQSEAPAAAPGVLTDYVVEFVSDIRRARATGAADEGRSNLRGVFDDATAQDCSIAQREAPDAAPDVLTDYVVEFVRDVRRARAAGAADVGRSNARGTFEGASAGRRGMVSNTEIWKGVSGNAPAPDRLMVDDVEIGSTREMSRSARTFDGRMRLESSGVSDVAKSEAVQKGQDWQIPRFCSCADSRQAHSASGVISALRKWTKPKQTR